MSNEAISLSAEMNDGRETMSYPVRRITAPREFTS